MCTKSSYSAFSSGVRISFSKSSCIRRRSTRSAAMTLSYLSISSCLLEMMYWNSRVRTRAICDFRSCTTRMLGIQRDDSSAAVVRTVASCTIEKIPTPTVSTSTTANASASLVASLNSRSQFMLFLFSQSRQDYHKFPQRNFYRTAIFPLRECEKRFSREITTVHCPRLPPLNRIGPAVARFAMPKYKKNGRPRNLYVVIRRRAQSAEVSCDSDVKHCKIVQLN